MRKLTILMMFLLALGGAAFAAEDPTGTWKGSMETPMGSQDNTFTFKVEGDKLTGTIANGMMGQLAIANGKFTEDKISFSIQSDFGTIVYTGTIKGDEMNLTLSVGDGQFTLNFGAKRVKTPPAQFGMLPAALLN